MWNALEIIDFIYQKVCAKGGRLKKHLIEDIKGSHQVKPMVSLLSGCAHVKHFKIKELKCCVQTLVSLTLAEV